MNSDKFEGSLQKKKQNSAIPVTCILNNTGVKSLEIINKDAIGSEQDMKEIKEYITSIGSQASSTSSISHFPD